MKITITDCDQGFIDPERNVIKKAGFDLDVHQVITPDEVISVAKNSDAIICQYAQINGDVFENLPNIKVVGRYGVGLDNIDLSYATKKGVKITHVPYFCFQEVANHTMGLILNLSRNIGNINHIIREKSKKSQISYGDMLKHMDNVERPTEQTIGIIGIGKIGSQVAKRAKVFGYKILVYDPYVPSEIISACDAEKVDLKTLLKKSDYISIHCPLNNETKNMISDKELSLMKKSAYIINTARGGIIDEKALIKSLKQKNIKGAALDVVSKEPIRKDHEFLDMDNVILTPHVGFYSKTSLIELKTKVAEYTVNALIEKGEYPLANPDIINGKK